jgi:lipoyl synthase
MPIWMPVPARDQQTRNALQPTPANHPVARYVPPDEYTRWRQYALDVATVGPFVRSSYQAGQYFH